MIDAVETAPPARAPWLLYLFLLGVFALVMPFDFLHSVRYLDQAGLTDISTSIERIEQGSLARRCGLLVLAAVGGLCWTARTRPMRPNGLLGLAACFFLAWAAASLAWSDAPALTARRLVILLALSLGALGMAARLRFVDIATFAFASGLFSLVAGLAAETALGTLRPWDTAHRFGGLINPVYQGISLSLLILASLALRRATGRRIFVAVAALAVPLLLLTRSRVPAAGAVLGVAAYLLLTARGSRKGFGVAAAVFAGSIATIVLGQTLVDLGARAMLMGRETSSVQTLTGRTPLWGACLEYVQARPWLGYGYESFWVPDRIVPITAATGFPAVDTHNAYLEWLLGLGIPGAVLGMALLALSLKRARGLHRLTDDPYHAFAFAALVVFCVNLFSVAIHLHHLTSFIVLVLVAKLAFDPEADPRRLGAEEFAEDAEGAGAYA